MPAAAVIPAPIAYTKVVAVKKLVVEFLSIARFGLGQASGLASVCKLYRCFGASYREQTFYFEKIRVFQAGLAGIQKHGIMELTQLCGWPEKCND